jgi:hypothetical protein
MNYIILNHVGHGDQIIMNGYIHYLLENPNTQKICIIITNNSKKTLIHLYSDYNQVSFHTFNNDSDDIFSMVNRKPFMSQCIFNNEIYHIINFGFHSENPNIYRKLYEQTNWATAFYLSVNVDPGIRYTHFKLPKNMSCSKDKYNKLIDKINTNKYILVHNDPSRGRFFNEDTIKEILQKNGNIDLPVIYCGINRYNYPLIPGLNNVEGVADIIACDSLLDYHDIIINATECHFMDSSLSALTDQIKNSLTLLYGHFYSTHGVVGDKNITVIKNWTILDK